MNETLFANSFGQVNVVVESGRYLEREEAFFSYQLEGIIDYKVLAPKRTRQEVISGLQIHLPYECRYLLSSH